MRAARNIFNWYPRLPFFYGWLVLGTGACGAFVATTVAGIVFGGIQGFIFEDTNWTRSTIGLAASLGVWASGLMGPIAGRMADRYNARWLMSAGAIVLGVCLISLGMFRSVAVFYAASIVGRAVSQPLFIGVVPRTLAVNFFQRRRYIALALIGMFRPVSGAIIIQLTSLIALATDWRTAFRYFGLFSLVLAIPMLLFIRRRPEDLGLLPDGASPLTQSSAPGGESGAEPAGVEHELEWTAREVFRTRTYWLVATSVFVITAAGSGVGFSMVPYLHEEAGLSMAQAAGVLSLSTFLALTTIVWGYIANKLTPRWCLIGTLMSASILILSLFWVNSLLSAYLFGLFWGLITSSQEALMSMLLADYYGRAVYGTISGALRPLEAGGLGLGQFIGPLIYDLTGSYDILWLMSAAMTLLASSLVILTFRPRTPTRVGETLRVT